MKTNSISLTVVGSLFFAVVVGVLTFQQVAAQVATSTEEVIATSSESVILLTDATVATTTTEIETVIAAPEPLPSDSETATSTAATAPTESSSVTSTNNPPPEGLTEVHIIGKKYIDYFTDGTTVTSYPGDPEIDSHLAEKDAPIPTHKGLTWKYTIGGGYIYDTASGDLEVGQYAVEPNGSYIEKRPPFVSSTSTPMVLGESTSATETPSDSAPASTTETTTDTVSSGTSSTSTASSSDSVI